MLKFFRRIRQKLLNEGNLKKYLIYAIGEIFLVVVGILIALQINNWNERRKNEQSENKALMELKYEFETNIKRLEIICNSKTESEIQVHNYIGIISNDSVSIDYKARVNPPGFIGMQWNATNSVLSGLLNSGKIENIKNDSLKYLLTQWPILVDRWNKREDEFFKNVRPGYKNYLETRISKALPRIDNREEWVPYYPNNVESRLKAQRKHFVNDTQYQNLLIEFANVLWTQVLFCSEIQNTYAQILKCLKEELKIRGIDI